MEIYRGWSRYYQLDSILLTLFFTRMRRQATAKAYSYQMVTVYIPLSAYEILLGISGINYVVLLITYLYYTTCFHLGW